MTKESLLKVESLTTYLENKEHVSLVTDVSFTLDAGKTLAIIGESGSGKTTLALSLLGLLPSHFSISGSVYFQGRDLLQLNEKKMWQLRGKEISMIFQDPDACLNPVFTIGDQVAEVFELHHQMSRDEADEAAAEILAKVGLPRISDVFDTYPHQISGGMRQRVMIAIAISSKPKLVIADEPTTALDVTVQKEILVLLKELQEQLEMALLIITHDLGVVAEMADDVAVMYASQMIEYGPVQQVFDSPLHPYTRALFAAVPGSKTQFRPKETFLPSEDTSLVFNGEKHWAKLSKERKC